MTRDGVGHAGFKKAPSPELVFVCSLLHFMGGANESTSTAH